MAKAWLQEETGGKGRVRSGADRSRRKRRKHRTSRRSRRPQASVATTLAFGGFKTGSCKRSTSELARGCRVALRPGLCSWPVSVEQQLTAVYQQHAFFFGFTGNRCPEILSAGLAPGKARPPPLRVGRTRRLRSRRYRVLGYFRQETAGGRRLEDRVCTSITAVSPRVRPA